LLGGFLAGNTRAIVEKRNAGFVQPLADNPVQGVSTAANKVRYGFVILQGGAFVSDLVSLVAVVNIGDVALFRKFDALFVWIFVEAPEQRAHTVSFPVIKAVGAALLGYVVDFQVKISAKGLNHLVEKSFGLTRILLVDGHRLGRRKGSCRRRIAHLSESQGRCQ